MVRIEVDSEAEKADLISASEHIHYSNIDTDIPMVNFLAHLYLSPDSIVVKTRSDDHACRNRYWG